MQYAQPESIAMLSAVDADLEQQEEREASILKQARQHSEAFAPLYQSYYERIYCYCLRRVGQAETAEDLTSVIFIRALSAVNSYRGGSVAAWLFKIAHNVVVNHLRSNHQQLSGDSATAALELIADAAASPIDQMVQAEQLRRVALLISRLPEDQRDLLALRMAGELSAKEIGAIIGKNEGAVRVALHRIVQQLRAAFAESEVVK